MAVLFALGCDGAMNALEHLTNNQTLPMKLKSILPTVTAALLAAALVGCATEKEEEAKLTSMAKVSRADAEHTALAKVPGGTIKDGELEKEKGKLIWSFDISIPGSADIKEVAVDAISGAVLSVETETPKQQAKEKEEDEAKENKK